MPAYFHSDNLGENLASHDPKGLRGAKLKVTVATLKIQIMGRLEHTPKCYQSYPQIQIRVHWERRPERAGLVLNMAECSSEQA